MAPSDIDTAERIVRLETKLDFLIDRLDKLPPSPVCVAKHVEFDGRLDDVDKLKNRFIGIMLVANILFVLFVDKIKTFFTAH